MTFQCFVVSAPVVPFTALNIFNADPLVLEVDAEDREHAVSKAVQEALELGIETPFALDRESLVETLEAARQNHLAAVSNWREAEAKHRPIKQDLNGRQEQWWRRSGADAVCCEEWED